MATLAGLELVYSDYFVASRPTPPKFSDAPLPAPVVDEFEAFKPNVLSNHLFVQNYGRRAEKSAPAAPSFGFDSDCIPSTSREPVMQLEKRAPSKTGCRIERNEKRTVVFDKNGEILALFVGSDVPSELLERFQ